MTSLLTFTKVSTILVQYFCIRQFSSILCLRTSSDISNTVLQKIKHTAFALKEFAALPVLSRYIREFRIILEEVATAFVQYCCLYQL